MFKYCDALIDYLCANNRHIRDMVRLVREVPEGYASRPLSTVNAWADHFIDCNPHQAALFVKRGWL